MCPGATPEEYHFNVFGSVNQSAETVPFPGAVALLQELHKEYYFSVLGSVNQLKLSHFREQLALMQELHEEHYFSVFGSVNQSAEIVPFPGAAGAPARAPQGVLFQCFWFSKSAETDLFPGAAGTTARAPQGVLFQCFQLSRCYQSVGFVLCPGAAGTAA